jgi:NitT/TauT family transport system permease protein
MLGSSGRMWSTEVRLAAPVPALGARWEPAASVALLLLGWQALATLADDRTFPGPTEVLDAIVQGLVSGPLLGDLAATLQRVALAFLASMAIGVAAGLALGRLPIADRWLGPLLLVLLNVPALVTIVLAYVALGLTEPALLAGVTLCSVAGVTVVVREGSRRLDAGLDDLAHVYRSTPARRFRLLTLPQLAPYVMAAARTALAMVWKIVLVAELLGASNGIGFELHTYFQMFDVTGIFACSVAFIACVLVFEALCLAPLDRRIAPR